MQTFQTACIPLPFQQPAFTFTCNSRRFCVLLPTAASRDRSYADECGCTGFSLSRWGLCGDVLSVLHLSHSGLSCLPTPSPVWPRFKGADVNHWFAISKLNNPYAFGEVGLFGFRLVMGQHQAVEYSIWWGVIFIHPILTAIRVCACASVYAGGSESYSRLEFNSEDVLPSRGVLCLQPQRLELCIYEEQPEKWKHTIQ